MSDKTRLDEMREQCVAFHEQHPEVWDMFVKFTFDMINRGFQNYSVNAIFQRIRWEIDAGGDGVTMFKINNNHAPFYSRRFMKMYPAHDGFFRLRVQTSDDKEATNLPELTPAYWSSV